MLDVQVANILTDNTWQNLFMFYSGGVVATVTPMLAVAKEAANKKDEDLTLLDLIAVLVMALLWPYHLIYFVFKS